MRFSILILVSLFYLTGCELIPPKNEESLALNKEELCELLQYDSDGKAGFLLEKGYEEKRLTEYPKYYGFPENEYAVFPVGDIAKIAISTDSNRYFYIIVFNENHRDSYLEFLSQFPEIKSPFPKESDKAGANLASISPSCSVKALGFIRYVNGFVVIIAEP